MGKRDCDEDFGSSKPSTSKVMDTKFDVFLNHRGPDTKNTFASLLKDALCHVGCEPFLDAKSLEKGQKAFDSIYNVLSGVQAHVAIFSPRYAESKYCLDELCEMLSSKKPLIVVFYNVEPENLRQTEVGPFAEAFHKHSKKGRIEEVKRWKKALIEVAWIYGSNYVDGINDIVKLKEEVVASVLHALPPTMMSPTARHPMGLQKSSSFVVKKLHAMGEKLGAIGICGMGGIGKTTLANEVYNQVRSKYQDHCFLKNVKDYEGKAMRDLQMTMLSSLFHMDLKVLPERWFEMIQKKKIFIVIDDLSEENQFYELIPALEHLMQGSQVLFTSRDSSILRSIMFDLPEPQQFLYHVSEMSFSNSLELFNWCAFRKKSLNDIHKSFHEYVKEIVMACKGVPLALEVMGGYMRDRRNELECWKGARLFLQSSGDIMTILQITYDGLKGDEEKLMFLDIACFMLGHPKYIALEIWKSIGYVAPELSLSKLVDKCSVKVDDTEQLV